MTKLNKQQCIALVRRGWSIEEISEMVGATTDEVRAYLTARGEI